MALLTKSNLIFGVARNWLNQNRKNAKKSDGGFLGLVIGKLPAEFFPIDCFEILNGWAGELLRYCHTSKFTGTDAMKKEGRVALRGMVAAPSKIFHVLCKMPCGALTALIDAKIADSSFAY